MNYQSKQSVLITLNIFIIILLFACKKTQHNRINQSEQICEKTIGAMWQDNTNTCNYPQSDADCNKVGSYIWGGVKCLPAQSSNNLYLLCKKLKKLDHDTVNTIKIITKMYQGSNCQAIFSYWYEQSSLNFSSTGIISVQPFVGLPNLKHLFLTNNSIKDLSALSTLENLQELQLSHNNIVDINPLIKLTKLKKLGLASNNIINSLPLAQLTNLTFLDLRENPTKNASKISHQGLTVYYDKKYIIPIQQPTQSITVPFQQQSYILTDQNSKSNQNNLADQNSKSTR